MQAIQKQKVADTLQHRIQRTERTLQAFRRVEQRFPWIRLAVLGAGLIAVYIVFQLLASPLEWLSVLLFLVVFIAVALLHKRVIDQIERLETFQKLLKTRLARVRLDWEEIPAPSPIKVPAEHPFASDLNVTGSRSLHQLLDTAVTSAGSRRLAKWLLAEAPDPELIARRHQLVRELLERNAFRTRLELDGLLAHPQASSPARAAREEPPSQAPAAPAETSARWDTHAILEWLESRPQSASLGPVLAILSLLALANIVLFSLNAVGLVPPLWIASFILYFLLQAYKFRETSELFDEAYGLSRQLGRLRVILADLENYPYPPGSALAALCAPYWQSAHRPSAALRQIGRIATAASLRNNPFLGLVLNILVPWDLFFAYQLDRYKRRLSSVLPEWLETLYELEALNALANFSAFNPENNFPVILPPDSRPVLTAVEIGHPLIPDAERVNNDFTLRSLGDVEIITGSNMSGKSTFLRTLGANLVLAYAGAPVAARELKTLPFRIYTSMNLADSLSDGISYFYAEVRRLKALLDHLEDDHPLPLFFLIDEIFRGTNNRERQLGSRAYTQSLANRNGAGLISTHDLELARLADSIPSVRNFHFREEVKDGKMVFDYKIRPGASPTTNALRIMALAGLPVDEAQQ